MHPITNTTAGLTLTVNDLGKRFSREWIFRKLNYTFESGNIYAVTGPNGSGKSTLLQVLWAQVPPSTGTLNYSFQSTPIEIDQVYRHMVVATPYMDLVDEFTLYEQLDFHFKLKQPREGLDIDSMLKAMYLEDSRNKMIGKFSSGMRQRVKLALAFFTKADIIFLDEPGTNLDQKAFDWYLDQVQRLPNEGIMIIASNQPSEYQAATRIISILDHK